MGPPLKHFASSLFPSISIIIITASVPFILTYINNKILSPKVNMYRVLWIAAFILNLVTVQMPGRFDSLVDKTDGLDRFPWRTLFSPSGWAFAIWGVIYLSELILTTFVATPYGNSIPAIKSATVYWMGANIYQSIWCLCFRPKYIDRLWLPAIQLISGAFSLNLAHSVSTTYLFAETNMFKKIGILLVRFPLALHAAWLTAAALLNTNTWVAVSKVTLSTQLSIAFASSYFAATLGAYWTILRCDPCIGLTIAWALAALADRTHSTPEVAELPQVARDSLAGTERALSTVLITLSVLTPFAIWALQVFQSYVKTKTE